VAQEVSRKKWDRGEYSLFTIVVIVMHKRYVDFDTLCAISLRIQNFVKKRMLVAGLSSRRPGFNTSHSPCGICGGPSSTKVLLQELGFSAAGIISQMLLKTFIFFHRSCLNLATEIVVK
jgi:hypothetical protein